MSSAIWFEAFLGATLTLRLFGEADPESLRARIVKAVATREADAAAFARIRSNERVLGPKLFKEWLRPRRAVMERGHPWREAEMT
jgi:hypothetical protein